MRKISFFVLLATLTFGSYACGDDDDETPVKKEDPQENKVDPEENNGEPGENNGDPNENNGNENANDPDFTLLMPDRSIFYADDNYFFVYLQGISSSDVTVKVVDESGSQVETSIENNGTQYFVKAPAQVGTFYMLATTANGKVVKSSPFSCIPVKFTSIMTDMDKPFIDLENGVALSLEEALANPSKVTLVVENGVGLVSPSVCSNSTISANGNSIEIDGKTTLEDTGYTEQFKLSNGKEGLITFMSISREYATGNFQIVSFNYSFK